jgi:hypothetical protein
VFSRYGKHLIIAALVVTTGAHWVALQTLAWATMLASNLRMHSVSGAMSDTFDGEHPCCLCKAIAAGKKSEKKSEAVSPLLKQEYPPVLEKTILFAPARFVVLPVADSAAESFLPKPPVPPPRGCFA